MYGGSVSTAKVGDHLEDGFDTPVEGCDSGIACSQLLEDLGRHLFSWPHREMPCHFDAPELVASPITIANSSQLCPTL